MTRMQFLMLRALEGGASLTVATDEALVWQLQHPDGDLFERRLHAAWVEAGHVGSDGTGGVAGEADVESHRD